MRQETLKQPWIPEMGGTGAQWHSSHWLGSLGSRQEDVYGLTPCKLPYSTTSSADTISGQAMYLGEQRDHLQTFTRTAQKPSLWWRRLVEGSPRAEIQLLLEEPKLHLTSSRKLDLAGLRFRRLSRETAEGAENTN